MNMALAMPSTIDEDGPFFRTSRPTSSDSSGTYSPSVFDFVSLFYSQLRRWQSETAFVSSSDEITAHPSYKTMVEHADLIAPFILDELRNQPSRLVWVLEEAFHVRPYPDEAVGDISAMTEAWLAWGERNGSIL